MSPRIIPPPFPLPVRFGLLLPLVTLVLMAPPAWGSQPSLPPAPLTRPDHPRQSDDAAYNQPIIFFEEGSTILVFYPNGDIIYRGRKLTRDAEVVRALQEILSLSPCRRKK